VTPNVWPQKPKLRVAAPRVAPKTKTGPKSRAKLRPAVIDKARAEAMALIERRRDLNDEGSVFLDKARRLLTRHWARADWTTRATLIETAGWLIRVATASPGARRRQGDC
jgi:hypothetical protein